MELCKEYKSMNCNEKSCCISESFELDCRLNLPQYLEDIERLIKCSVKNIVCDYEFSGSEIKIFGKSIISILYLDSDGCPYSNEFEEDFSKSFDLNDCEYFCFAQVRLNTKYYNHRLINQRRIDVHSSVGVCIDVYCKNTSKCLCSCENAFTKEIETSTLADKNSGVCSAEFDEIFSIPKSDYQIKNIVNAFITSSVEDKKIIKDKMLVKIRNELSVIYINENNSVEKCLHSFSVSKIIETSECDEGDTAFITSEISQLYIKAKSDDGNMLNDIEAVGRLSISYSIKCVQKLSMIVDSYVPHYSVKTQQQQIMLKCSPVYYNDEKTAQLTVDCDKNIIEITDLKAEIISCKLDKSAVLLQLAICAVYYDDDSQFCYIEKNADYSFSLNDNELDGDVCVNLLSFDFVIKNTDKISLRINFEYSAYLYKMQTFTYLTDIEADAQVPPGDAPELTLYFADRGEKVWDIAKSFSTDVKLIMEENELSSDVLDGRRVLLVPGM